jgi:hypothetical protein
MLKVEKISREGFLKKNPQRLNAKGMLFMQILKLLIQDFPNIKEDISELLQKKMSLLAICRHYRHLGYVISETSMRNLFKKLNIETPKTKTYTGEKNPFYGKKHTQATKSKLSKIAKEQKRQEGERNYFYGKSGDKSPNWKGGVSSRYAIFYSSSSWKNKRFEIMKKDNFKCKVCNFIPAKSHGKLNVHHIIRLSKDWNLRLNNDNLITLCVECHNETFGKEDDLVKTFQDIVRTL